MIKLGHVGIALICDICGETIEGFHDLEEVAAHEKEMGWIKKRIKGKRKDICPECQEG